MQFTHLSSFFFLESYMQFIHLWKEKKNQLFSHLLNLFYFFFFIGSKGSVYETFMWKNYTIIIIIILIGSACYTVFLTEIMSIFGIPASRTRFLQWLPVFLADPFSVSPSSKACTMSYVFEASSRLSTFHWLYYRSGQS